MVKCGCGMMIECEVKTVQTVESIEHTRREGGDGVGTQISNGGWLNEVGLWKEWREQNEETVLVREDTRRKCGQTIAPEMECERGKERGDDNGMEREWNQMREERPVKMEEGREERML